MSENERQQRMVERILEDEGLRGDLEDTAATALVNWASKRAEAAAADPARPDDAVEADVQAIRAAALAAAQSRETDPRRLVAKAEAALAPGKGDTSASGKAAVPASHPATEPAPASPSSSPADQATTAPPRRGIVRPGRRRWQRFVGWLKHKRTGR